MLLLSFINYIDSYMDIYILVFAKKLLTDVV